MERAVRETTALNVILGYFKKENIEEITSEMSLTFENKYFNDIHNKESIASFNNTFNVDERIFWSVSCILSRIQTSNKIRTKKFAETNINNHRIQIFSKGMTVKLIVNGYIPLFFTMKEKCLGSVSLTDNGKFWYSHINSDVERQLGINSLRERNDFVEQIISVLENKLAA